MAVAGDVVPLIMLIGTHGLPCCSEKQSPGNYLLLQSIDQRRSVFRLQPAVIDALMAQLQLYVQAGSAQICSWMRFAV